MKTYKNLKIIIDTFLNITGKTNGRILAISLPDVPLFIMTVNWGLHPLKLFTIPCFLLLYFNTSLSPIFEFVSTLG